VSKQVMCILNLRGKIAIEQAFAFQHEVF
jgi:hypothetical protein